jgi:hypothetical protein
MSRAGRDLPKTYKRARIKGDDAEGDGWQP